MSEDIVKFLMPDGTEVSNDPRWVAEQGKTAMEAALEVTPNRGKEGPTPEEQAATMGGGVSTPQSSQPGVGEHAVEEDPNKYGAGDVSGRLVQRDDREFANEHGFSASEPGVESPEAMDVNKAVQEVREKEAQRLEELNEARNALLEEDPDYRGKPYSEWTAKQLTNEVKMRRAQGEDIQFEGKSKKDAVAALEAADQAKSGN